MEKNHSSNKQSKENVISFDTSIYNEELEILHDDLLDFTFSNYGEFLHEQIEESLEDIIEQLDEEEYEAYLSISIAAAIMHLTMTKNKATIFDFFKETLKMKHIRKRTRKVIDQWGETVPSAYEIINIDNSYALLEDIVSREPFNLKLMDDEELAVGQLLLGTLIPFVDHYQFFFSVIEINSALKDTLRSQLSSFQKTENIGPDFPVFLAEFAAVDPLPIATWENETYEAVYQLFLEKNETKATPDDLREIALKLWQQFCFQLKPKITRINPYAAALDYFIQHFVAEDETITQKQLAEEYETTTSSISLHSRRFHPFMNEVFQEMAESEEHFLNEAIDGTNKKDAKVRALHLLMKATEGNPLRRKKLIQDALKIYPNLPEAYLMLAEEALSIEEILVHLEKTMEISKKEMGDALTPDTGGNLWVQHEVRPYLRAKELYAFYLIHYHNDIDSAIKHYQELLALNALDNQGIRYRLLTLYLDIGDFDAAENLIHDYSEEYTAPFLFNKALLAYKKNGLTDETTQLIQEANKQNPYVIDYLLGKKEIPEEIDYIVLGEDSEAIEYAQENSHLWDNDALPLLASL